MVFDLPLSCLSWSSSCKVQSVCACHVGVALFSSCFLPLAHPQCPPPFLNFQYYLLLLISELSIVKATPPLPPLPIIIFFLTTLTCVQDSAPKHTLPQQYILILDFHTVVVFVNRDKNAMLFIGWERRSLMKWAL